MPFLPRIQKTLGRKNVTGSIRAIELNEVTAATAIMTAIMTAIVTAIEIEVEIETESGMLIETVSVVNEAETGVREKRMQIAWIF